MKNNGYNRYTNWETWLTMLHYEEYLRDAAHDVIERTQDYNEKKIAEAMADIVWDLLSEDLTPWSGLLRDFVIDAYSKINFIELAEKIEL